MKVTLRLYIERYLGKSITTILGSAKWVKKFIFLPFIPVIRFRNIIQGYEINYQLKKWSSSK